MNTVSSSLGLAIRTARKEKGMSQDILGNLVGLQKSQISRVENGMCRSMTTIDRILGVLNLTPVIDLKPVPKQLTLSEVLSILKKYKMENKDRFGIESMGLFGSYARQENNSESDIDVCVKLSSPSYINRATIKDELEEEFGIDVDVISLSAKMDEGFKTNLLNEAIYV